MKNILKFVVGAAGILCVNASVAPAARATDLIRHTADMITTKAGKQLGRMGRATTSAYRNQQSWIPAVSGETTYPGAVNTTTTYYYVKYTFTAAQIGNGKYVEVIINEPGVNNVFASAWTSYSGTSSVMSGTGWLGDAASSENYFGATDARYFDVTIPAGSGFTVVVNTTSAAGIGEAYGIIVSAYATTDYTDATITAAPRSSTPAPTPESAAWAMLDGGTLTDDGAASRRRRALA